MFKAILPPFCLLLALASAIVGFSMLAFGGPEASISLHQARAEGDELATDTLEADLAERQSNRVVMIISLFVVSGVMTIVAFGAMQGPAKKRI
ncbi:hypothetical protein ACFL2H_05460 [Planctomycetota bacterium]